MILDLEYTLARKETHRQNGWKIRKSNLTQLQKMQIWRRKRWKKAKDAMVQAEEKYAKICEELDLAERKITKKTKNKNKTEKNKKKNKQTKNPPSEVLWSTVEYERNFEGFENQCIWHEAWCGKTRQLDRFTQVWPHNFWRQRQKSKETEKKQSKETEFGQFTNDQCVWFDRRITWDSMCKES